MIFFHESSDFSIESPLALLTGAVAVGGEELEVAFQLLDEVFLLLDLLDLGLEDGLKLAVLLLVALQLLLEFKVLLLEVAVLVTQLYHHSGSIWTYSLFTFYLAVSKGDNGMDGILLTSFVSDVEFESGDRVFEFSLEVGGLVDD